MSIFGLATRKEQKQQIDDAVKQAMSKLPQWLLQTAGAETYALPDPSMYGNQAELYRRLSWVLAAVMHVASEAALASGQVMQRKGEESEGIQNHPFEERLAVPNPLDSHYEFLYATVAMKKLTGNAYWWLNRTSENATPDEIWLIPSHMIRPLPDQQMYIKNYLYNPGSGREIALEPWEIVHFRSFNPFSRFVGLSAIESLAMTAKTMLGMEKVSSSYYNEGGGRAPAFLLFAEMIGEDQWARIKEDTKAAARDRQLMMLRGTGSGDVTLLQNAVSQKDQELLGQMDAAREEIFTVLAPGLASMLDVSATEANALAGRATFKERAVYPELVAIQEKITTVILPSYGDKLFYEYDDIRWADRQMELSEMAQYEKTHTIEEIRKKYYNDAALGDDRDLLFPIQLKPTASIQQPAAPTQQPAIEQPVAMPAQNAELGPEQVKALVEIDRWEEKSKKAKKLTAWHAVNLPTDIHAAVKAGEMTFAQAREKIKASVAPARSEANNILEAIRLEVQAISKKEIDNVSSV
jgi:phage portal protein BeeE